MGVRTKFSEMLCPKASPLDLDFVPGPSFSIFCIFASDQFGTDMECVLQQPITERLERLKTRGNNGHNLADIGPFTIIRTIIARVKFVCCLMLIAFLSVDRF